MASMYRSAGGDGEAALMQQAIDKNRHNVVYLLQWLRDELVLLRDWDTSEMYFPSTNITACIVYCLGMLRRKCREQEHTTLYAYIDHYVADKIHIAALCDGVDVPERARVSQHVNLDADRGATMCQWLGAYSVARSTCVQQRILRAVQRYLQGVGVHAIECGIAYYGAWTSSVPRAVQHTWARAWGVFRGAQDTLASYYQSAAPPPAAGGAGQYEEGDLLCDGGAPYASPSEHFGAR